MAESWGNNTATQYDEDLVSDHPLTSISLVFPASAWIAGEVVTLNPEEKNAQT